MEGEMGHRLIFGTIIKVNKKLCFQKVKTLEQRNDSTGMIKYVPLWYEPIETPKPINRLGVVDDYEWPGEKYGMMPWKFKYSGIYNELVEYKGSPF